MRRAAFYDLDGTLVDLNLVHITLFVLANLGEWTNRLSYIAAFAVRAPRLYLAEQQDRRKLNILMFEAFRVSRAIAWLSSDASTASACSSIIYTPKASKLVEANRRAGLEPVLVTGSPDWVNRAVGGTSQHRGFFREPNDDKPRPRYRTPARADHGDRGKRPFGASKYATQHGLKLADCWGYADSHYDLPFLNALGHPVAVNPDKRLRATAMSRQWPIIQLEKNRRSSNVIADNVRRLVEV